MTSKSENDKLSKIISELSARSREQIKKCRSIQAEHQKLLKKLGAVEKAMKIAKRGKKKSN